MDLNEFITHSFDKEYVRQTVNRGGLVLPTDKWYRLWPYANGLRGIVRNTIHCLRCPRHDDDDVLLKTCLKLY